ncbi:hypothetical protein WR25_25679 [Diploscapter pachys]|uniref:Uncharacterized protein n=1 Tax=Diploscapter pachys TaxID=2018661 RepID=A0A2A2K646_9BILA|nr:hypothetical protein WR25_25679 [Diploscapter pachys]
MIVTTVRRSTTRCRELRSTGFGKGSRWGQQVAQRRESRPGALLRSLTIALNTGPTSRPTNNAIKISRATGTEGEVQPNRIKDTACWFSRKKNNTSTMRARMKKANKARRRLRIAFSLSISAGHGLIR